MNKLVRFVTLEFGQMGKVTEPVSTMSTTRRDKSDKGSGKEAKQDTTSSKEDRLNHRSTTTSGDGLDGAVAADAPAVTKERQKRLSSRLSPPKGKDLSTARSESATNSPVLKRAETH